METLEVSKLDKSTDIKFLYDKNTYHIESTFEVSKFPKLTDLKEVHPSNNKPMHITFNE